MSEIRPYSPDPDSDDYPTAMESIEAAMRREAFSRQPGMKAWGCLRETQAAQEGKDPFRCLSYCGHPACPTSPYPADALKDLADRLMAFRHEHWTHWTADENQLVVDCFLVIRTAGVGIPVGGRTE